MAKFFANWSATDRPVFPYNSGTKTWIEGQQVPQDRARKGLKHRTNNSIRICHNSFFAC